MLKALRETKKPAAKRQQENEMNTFKERLSTTFAGYGKIQTFMLLKKLI